MCPSLTPKRKKERPQESFQLINTSNLSNIFEWLSMTFLASFLKTETLVMENYCPDYVESCSSQKISNGYLFKRRAFFQLNSDKKCGNVYYKKLYKKQQRKNAFFIIRDLELKTSKWWKWSVKELRKTKIGALKQVYPW